MGLFKRRSPEEKFWKWFTSNEEAIFRFEENRDEVFGKLTQRLQELNEDLTFEFGPVENDRRELFISAGGIKSAFPAVYALVEKAPPLPRWIILPLIPRRKVTSGVQLGNTAVEASEVSFAIWREPGEEVTVGIALYFDGYDEANEQTWMQIGFIFLDFALGEYDVACKIGPISFYSSEHVDALKRHPLSELPQVFDEVYLAPE